MARKKPRSPTDPWVKRPQSNLTAHEVMAQIDARNMTKLARDLITFMPPPFKETLRSRGCLFLNLEEYTIQIANKRKFPVV